MNGLTRAALLTNVMGQIMIVIAVFTVSSLGRTLAPFGIAMILLSVFIYMLSEREPREDVLKLVRCRGDNSLFFECIHGRIDTMYNEVACMKRRRKCRDWKSCKERIPRLPEEKDEKSAADKP